MNDATTLTWTSLLPPVLAIGAALVTRQVLLSLFAGIWLGTALLNGADGWLAPLSGLGRALESCVTVFADAGNTRVILFSALVGGLIALTRFGGGVDGFVDRITTGRGINSPRRVRLLTWVIGVLVFVESSITSLINGAISRPLFDRHRLSRAELAYLCDSTAAPVCILLPLNAWGAYLIGLLSAEGVADPIYGLLAATPYNLYAIAALALALWVAYRGTFKRSAPATMAEHAPPAEGDAATDPAATPAHPKSPRRALDFIAPVVGMVVMMPVGLWITGDGDLLRGSGSTAVFWAVLVGIALAALPIRLRGLADTATIMGVAMRGVGALVPLAALMVLAFALGDVTRELGTGRYVAELARAAVPVALLPALLFVLAGAIAFSTGTSWGTFALLIPLAVPLAGGPEGAAAAPLIGAVLAGGIFGDHCSPISDTTVIASVASGCDHMEHVRTQLPYALLAGGVAVAGYLVIGVVGMG